VKMRIAGIN